MPREGRRTPLIVTFTLLYALARSASAGPATPVLFETVAQGIHSGILTPTQVVVRTEASWRALWLRHTRSFSRRPAPPTVDFSRFIVIAVFGGRSPAGSLIVIEQVTRQEEGLVVVMNVVTTRAMPPAQAAPFHIIRLPRTDLPIVFAIEAALQEPIDPPIEPHGR